MYHEKQSLQLCAVHTLNNLVQSRRFTKSSLDKICLELSPGSFINPHKSIFGTGNYDVNVITQACCSLGYNVKWFDKRIDVKRVILDEVFGMIVNVVSSGFPWLGGSHWYCIRRIGAQWYNLDSKLNEPLLIPDLPAQFGTLLQQPSTTLLLVVIAGREVIYEEG